MKRLLHLFLILGFFQLDAQHISEEELKPLDFLVGEWNVQAEVRLSKQGPWEKSDAKSVIRKIMNESVLEEEYNGTKQGHTITSKTLLANDNRTKLYQKVFVDSDHGTLILYEGKLENKILNLYYKFNLNGVDLILRSQYSLISENSFTVVSSRSVDNGTTWDRTGALTYTRAR
jgi:hypothetical protein